MSTSPPAAGRSSWPVAAVSASAWRIKCSMVRVLQLMRQALADTAAASQDDRPAAGGDVDMVDQGAAAPDPEVPTGVSLSKAQNESLAKMAGERKRQLLQMSHAHFRPCRSPGCNHHRRTARDAPASKRLAPWVPHHTWKLARLTHTARGPPGSRTARGPALSVPRMAWHASRKSSDL